MHDDKLQPLAMGNGISRIGGFGTQSAFPTARLRSIQLRKHSKNGGPWQVDIGIIFSFPASRHISISHVFPGKSTTGLSVKHLVPGWAGCSGVATAERHQAQGEPLPTAGKSGLFTLYGLAYSACKANAP
ncbi:hypothetical protein J3459_015368 [Metarhizium acridum]|uniref:uncharacterized protein n=1 Tax=Metarhizium acridum TaxID=92637 RepID=UPI001C6BD6B0|nr:hypothetical protein J3459_015368 [Metarhizium acridum]KAG8414058.1 hypothetical protein J3458_011711 [Metarhizium acridum]